LHDRFLALIEDNWHTADNGLQMRVGILLTESGRAAEGAEWIAAELETRLAATDRRNWRDGQGWMMAWLTLAARLGKRPDLALKPEELRAQIGKGNYIKPINPLLRYLAGDCDRDTAITQAGADVDELRYYLGLDALGRGDLAQARSDLAVVMAHTDWNESGGVRRLLTWIDAGARQAPRGKKAPSDF